MGGCSSNQKRGAAADADGNRSNTRVDGQHPDADGSAGSVRGTTNANVLFSNSDLAMTVQTHTIGTTAPPRQFVQADEARVDEVKNYGVSSVDPEPASTALPSSKSSSNHCPPVLEELAQEEQRQTEDERTRNIKMNRLNREEQEHQISRSSFQNEGRPGSFAADAPLVPKNLSETVFDQEKEWGRGTTEEAEEADNLHNSSVTSALLRLLEADDDDIVDGTLQPPTKTTSRVTAGGRNPTTSSMMGDSPSPTGDPNASTDFGDHRIEDSFVGPAEGGGFLCGACKY